MFISNLKKHLGKTCVALLCAFTGSSSQAVDLNFTPNFRLDQQAPEVAFGSDGGVMIWQDLQSATGQFSIKGVRLNSDLVVDNGIFFVNDENATGFQENAEVTALPNGGFAFTWQSGEDAHQQIHLRVMDENGVFKGPSIATTPQPGYHGQPTIASGDNKIMIAWESFDGNSGTAHNVMGKFYDLNGNSLSSSFPLSRKYSGNQSNPSLAHIGDDKFGAVWVDETENLFPTEDLPASHFVRLAGKTFSDPSDAQNNDSYLTDQSLFIANPRLKEDGDGGLACVYSCKHSKDSQNPWIAELLELSEDLEVEGLTSYKSDSTKDQLSPDVYVDDFGTVVTWMSRSEDGDDFDIFASRGGADDAFQVNTADFGHQMFPVISSVNKRGSSLVLWTGFNSIYRGFDIFGKILETPDEIPAPPTIFAYPSSSNAVNVSMVTPLGQNAPSFELEYEHDGVSNTVSMVGNHHVINGLAPGTTIQVKGRYTNNEGLTSDWSNSADTTSWGSDSNFDGLPDDWQQQHFGNDLALLPKIDISGFADFDKDGASNLSEFLAGTSPVDAESVLKVAIGIIDGSLNISWNTHPGGIYVLEGSNNLESWKKFGVQRLATDDQDSIFIENQNQATYFRVIRIK